MILTCISLEANDVDRLLAACWPFAYLLWRLVDIFYLDIIHVTKFTFESVYFAGW